MVRVKEDDLRRVDELPAQILGQNDAVQVFAAAGRIIHGLAVEHGVMHLFQMGREIQIQPQLVDDLGIARRKLRKDLLEFRQLPLARQFMAGVEHIRDLGIVRLPATGRGGHDIHAVGIPEQNLLDLSELRRFRQRAAAELGNHNTHLYKSPFKTLRLF